MFVDAGRILIKQQYLLHAREERADMAVTIESRYSRSIHPLHAVSLAGTVPLFLGAALSDAEYASTYEIQWSNFASWLIVGGLIFGGIALLFAIIDLSRASSSRPWHRRLFRRTAGRMDRGLFQCSDARPRRMGEHAWWPGDVGHDCSARVLGDMVWLCNAAHQGNAMKRSCMIAAATIATLLSGCGRRSRIFAVRSRSTTAATQSRAAAQDDHRRAREVGRSAAHCPAGLRDQRYRH